MNKSEHIYIHHLSVNNWNLCSSDWKIDSLFAQIEDSPIFPKLESCGAVISIIAGFSIGKYYRDTNKIHECTGFILLEQRQRDDICYDRDATEASGSCSSKRENLPTML